MSELTDERLRAVREYYFENTHFLLERDVVAAIDELLAYRARQESQNARDTVRLDWLESLPKHAVYVRNCETDPQRLYFGCITERLRVYIDEAMEHAAMSPSVPDTKKGDEK